MLVRFTYCFPEAIRPVEPPLLNERGVLVTERVPGSPTRSARSWEVGGWWEEVADGGEVGEPGE